MCKLAKYQHDNFGQTSCDHLHCQHWVIIVLIGWFIVSGWCSGTKGRGHPDTEDAPTMSLSKVRDDSRRLRNFTCLNYKHLMSGNNSWSSGSLAPPGAWVPQRPTGVP